MFQRMCSILSQKMISAIFLCTQEFISSVLVLHNTPPSPHPHLPQVVWMLSVTEGQHFITGDILIIYGCVLFTTGLHVPCKVGHVYKIAFLGNTHLNGSSGLRTSWYSYLHNKKFEMRNNSQANMKSVSNLPF